MVQDGDFSRHSQQRSYGDKHQKDRRLSRTSTETTQSPTTASEAAFSSSVPLPNAADRSSRSSINESSSREMNDSIATSKTFADDIDNDIPKEIVIFADEEYVDGNHFRFDAMSPVVTVRKAVEIVTRRRSCPTESSSIIRLQKQDSIPRMPLPLSHRQRQSASAVAAPAPALPEAEDAVIRTASRWQV
jgi:hypothetical protein